MAQIIRTTSPQHPNEEKVLQTLAQRLPNHFILLPNVQLAHQAHSLETDIVLIKPDGIMTIELKHWYGRIVAETPFSDVTVGKREGMLPSPVLQAQNQAKRLASYVRRGDIWPLFMGQPKAAKHVPFYVHSVLLFTHPGADIQIPYQQKVQVLHIDDDDLVEQLDRLKFSGGTRLNGEQAGRLSDVLLNRLVPSLPPAQPAPHTATSSEKTADVDNAQQALETTLAKLEQVAKQTVPAPRQQPKPQPPQPAQVAKEVAPVATAEPVAEVEIAPATKAEIDELEDLDFVYKPSEEAAEGSAAVQARPQPHTVRRPWWRKVVNIVENATSFAEAQVTRVEEIARPFEAQQSQGVNAHQLVRHIERRLNNTLAYLIHETIAHNHFMVYLPTPDYLACFDYKPRLEQVLCCEVETIITNRGYETLGDLHVEIRELEQSANMLVDSAIVESLEQPDHVVSSPLYLVAAETGEQFPLSEQMTIGRTQDNDVCLGQTRQRQRISQYQARICLENGRYVLYDGGQRPSKNGTYLNGARVSPGKGHPIQAGDVIQCGFLGRRNREQQYAASLQLQRG